MRVLRFQKTHWRRNSFIGSATKHGENCNQGYAAMTKQANTSSVGNCPSDRHLGRSSNTRGSNPDRWVGLVGSSASATVIRRKKITARRLSGNTTEKKSESPSGNNVASQRSPLQPADAANPVDGPNRYDTGDDNQQTCFERCISLTKHILFPSPQNERPSMRTFLFPLALVVWGNSITTTSHHSPQTSQQC